MEILRKVVAGLVALTGSLIFIHHSHAVAPVQKGQAPGYYRMMLGDFEIVALSDGKALARNHFVRRLGASGPQGIGVCGRILVRRRHVHYLDLA